MKLSFFASSIYPHKWEKFLDSLKNNTCPYEVVFAGPIDKSIVFEFTERYPELKYIITENIKPSQCAEVARRHCSGDFVCWVDDDYTFSEKFVDTIYDYMVKVGGYLYNNILSVNTINPDLPNYDKNNYRFFGRNLNTPLMAEVGIMDRHYLDRLGGIDCRYITGQWDRDICMRAMAVGGKVISLPEPSVTVDHKNKNGEYNNFWSGWNEDSEQLENSWVKGGYKRFDDGMMIVPRNAAPFWYYPISNGEVVFKRNDNFQPFEDKDLLTISQGNEGIWFSRWG